MSLTLNMKSVYIYSNFIEIRADSQNKHNSSHYLLKECFPLRDCVEVKH